MKIDLYTKGVLTVIAVCLVYLCLGRPAVFPTAQAQAQRTHVILDGWSYGDGSAFEQSIEAHPLPVRIVPQR